MMEDLIVTDNIEAELLRCLSEIEAAERQLSLQLSIASSRCSKPSIISKLLDRVEYLRAGVEEIENRVKDIVYAQSIMEVTKQQNKRHASFLVNVMKTNNLITGLEHEFQQMQSIAQTLALQGHGCGISNTNSVDPSMLTGSKVGPIGSQSVSDWSSPTVALPKTDRTRPITTSCSEVESMPLIPQRSQTARSQRQNFKPISEAKFNQIPELVRRRAKLEDLNALYGYLCHKAASRGPQWITTRQLFEVGFSCAGQTGEAKLQSLRFLNLCELSKDGTVKLRSRSGASL